MKAAILKQAQNLVRCHGTRARPRPRALTTTSIWLLVILFSIMIPVAVGSASWWDQLKEAGKQVKEEVIDPTIEKITPPSGNQQKQEPKPAGESKPSYTKTQVRQVQHLLQKLGYKPGIVDGVYGSATATAIRAYQADHGLPQTGSPSNELIAHLRKTFVSKQVVSTHKTAPAAFSSAKSVTPQDTAVTVPSPEGKKVTEAQAPALNYANLLRLYIASHADLLNNEAFAWHYFQIYKAPEMRTPECSDLQRKALNSIRFEQLYEKEYAAFKEELVKLGNAPTSGVFTSPAWVQLNNYDMARAAFPVVAVHLGYSRALEPQFRCKTYKVPPGPNYAPRGFDNRLITLPGRNMMPKEIPVDKDVATKWLDDHSFNNQIKQMQATVTVRVHPLPFVSNSQTLKIPGEVIGLTVMDPLTGKPYRSFRFSIESQDEKIAGKASSHGLMTLTSSAAALYLIRNHPDILRTEVVQELTRRYIRTEQEYWQHIDDNVTSYRQQLESGGSISPGNVNEKRLLFAYEWQLLRKNNPDLARAVLEVFIRPDPSWEFYRKEPAFDPRLKAFVEASIFSREVLGLPSVQTLMTQDVGSLSRIRYTGHPSSDKLPAAEFLLPKLTPVMLDFIHESAQAMPERIKLDINLFGKFEAADSRLLLRTQSSEFSDTKPLMPLPMPRRKSFAADGEKIESMLHVPLPMSAKKRFVYLLGHHNLPEQPRPSIYKSNTPTDAWRNIIGGSMGLGHMNFGNVSALALDREVAFPRVKVSRKTVERAIGNSYSAGYFPVTGRVILDIQGVDIVRLKAKPDEEVYNGVIRARVSGLELVDDNGRLIHSFDVASLTSAAEVTNAKQVAKVKALAAKKEARAQKEHMQTARREALHMADVIGIRIGMDVREAERIIREHMDVGWIGKLSSNKPAVSVRSPNRPYSHFKTYISADGSEYVALFWHPEVSSRLMAVTRTLMLPKDIKQDEVLVQLKDKYGADVLVSPPNRASWVWTSDYGKAPAVKHIANPTDAYRFRMGQCYATSRSSFGISSLDIIEGKPVTRDVLRRLPSGMGATIIDVYGGKGGTYSDPKWDPHAWTACGPAVSAAINPRNSGKTLSVGIFDLAAYASVYNKVIKGKMAKGIHKLPL